MIIRNGEITSKTIERDNPHDLAVTGEVMSRRFKEVIAAREEPGVPTMGAGGDDHRHGRAGEGDRLPTDAELTHKGANGWRAYPALSMASDKKSTPRSA